MLTKAYLVARSIVGQSGGAHLHDPGLVLLRDEEETSDDGVESALDGRDADLGVLVFELRRYDLKHDDKTVWF